MDEMEFSEAESKTHDLMYVFPSVSLSVSGLTTLRSSEYQQYQEASVEDEEAEYEEEGEYDQEDADEEEQ